MAASIGGVELQAGVASCDQNKENIISSIKDGGDRSVFIDQIQSVDDDGQEMRSETQSPRRMKDIHLDGNVDDMRNVDPYMLDDGDLDIRSDVGGVAGSMSSLMSGRSSTVKSVTSSRRQKIKSAGTPVPRSNAGSRARQLKEHEGSPFLAVGTPQERIAFSPEIITGKKSRSPFKGSRHSSLLSVSTVGLTSHSTKSSMEMPPSARTHRAKLFSSNSMIAPSNRQPEPNHNVKMPFKHNVKKPDMNAPASNPSIAMKDRTVIATHTLNKILHAQKPTQTAYIQGRLLKARLKPLEPVTMTTPTIHQCRGIVSETRQYGQSESRTFQRWKSIMAGNNHRQHLAMAAANNNRHAPYDPRDGAASTTTESVHQTSEASTPEPGMDFPIMANYEEFVDDDDDDDVEWAVELDGMNDNGIPQIVDPPQPFSLPNSRCAPNHCDQDLSHLNGPAMTPVPAANKGQGHSQGKTTPAMMIITSTTVSPALSKQEVVLSTGINVEEEDAAVEEMSTNGGLGTSDTIGETNTVASSSGIGMADQTVGVMPLGDSLNLSLSKRPHSAVVESNNTALKESRLAGRRPKTAVDGSRKAVRFADENIESSSGGRNGLTDMNGLFGGGSSSDNKEDEERVKKRQGGSKNGGGGGKSSCKPRSLDSGFDDRDDKDDDDGGGGGGRKGRVFLTQGFGGSSSGGGGGGQSNQQQQQQQQQQKGGKRSTAQGSNGKQNSSLRNNNNDDNNNSASISPNIDSSSSSRDKSAISTSLGKQNESAENLNRLSSSCLSATVIYACPDDNPSTKNPKAGFTSQKSMGNKNKKAKTPRKNAAEPSGNDLSKQNTSEISNQYAVKSEEEGKISKKNNSNDGKKEENESIPLKSSSLCKQESSDSGISDTMKDETKSHDIIKESQHTVNNPAVATQSQAMIRPSSSSMKRMKAYKTLVAKSKRGNVRPYSGSVYSDVEIQDRKATSKLRKDSRPASAFSTSSCSDISHIQGKYGLYAGAKQANFTPTTQKSRVSSSYSASSNISKSDKGDNNDSNINKSRNSNPISSSLTSKSFVISAKDGYESQFSDNNNLLQVEHNNVHYGDMDSDSSSSLRPKSASKVTFADEDEYEDDRKSIATSAKSHTTTASSSILRGSATGYTHHHHSKGGKHGDKTPDDVDYDQMWAELPDDNSDAEIYHNDDENVDDEDDFMSKFDMLEYQFNAVAAQFKAEKTKLSSKDLIPAPPNVKSSPRLAISATTTTTTSTTTSNERDNDEAFAAVSTSQNALDTPSNNQNVSEYAYSGDVFVSEEEMAEIRESGYELETNNGIFVTDSSTFDHDDTQTINANNNSSSNNDNCKDLCSHHDDGDDDGDDENEKFGIGSRRKQLGTSSSASSSLPEFLHYEEPSWKENGWVCAEISRNLYKSTNRYVEIKPKGKDGGGGGSSNLSKNDNNNSNKDSKKSSTSSSGSITSRIDHGQKKQQTNSKGGNNNHQQGRKGSRGESNENKEESLNSEYRKPVYRMEGHDGNSNTSNSNPSSVHIVIPNIDDFGFGFGFSCEGTAKPKSNRALSSRATTPVAARKLLSKDKKGNDYDQTSGGNGGERKKNKDSNDLCIDANSCSIVDHRASVTPVPKELNGRDTTTTRKNNDDKCSQNTLSNLINSSSTITPGASSCSSSFSSKESQERRTEKMEVESEEKTNNYYDLLLAYRSHCMEDSDDDNDDDDNDDDDNDDDDGDDENDNNNTRTDDKNRCNGVNDDAVKKVEADHDSRKDEKETRSSSAEKDRLSRSNDDKSQTDFNFKIDSSKQNGGKTFSEAGGGQGRINNGDRPISAVTTDSGVESDDTPTEDVRGAGLNLSHQSDSSSGGHVTRANQSQSLSQSRPDSGVSSDAGMDKRGSIQSEPLEIVASSKNLIKQRPSSASSSGGASQPSENMEKLCELPPLCFRLNARPPTGFLYYFAYGPNMNSDRIACYLGCEKSPPRFWGLLFGFGMVFNMKGTSSNSDQAGGLPNLEWNPAMSVEGCVYQITQEQLDRLDKFVGYPKTVEHVVLPVWMSNSLDPDSLGVAQYCIPALTFIARDDFTWTEPVPPSDYSVSQCIKSADLVTPEFKDHLVSFSRSNQLALVAAS